MPSDADETTAQVQENDASMMFKHLSKSLFIPITCHKGKGHMIPDDPHANCCFSNDKLMARKTNTGTRQQAQSFDFGQTFRQVSRQRGRQADG